MYRAHPYAGLPLIQEVVSLEVLDQKVLEAKLQVHTNISDGVKESLELDLAILLASGEFIELLENSHIFVGPL
jgi:hypothetical protein